MGPQDGKGGDTKPIPIYPVPETFTTTMSLKPLKRDHLPMLQRGNRPREHKVNRKSTAETILEPKSLSELDRI